MPRYRSVKGYSIFKDLPGINGEHLAAKRLYLIAEEHGAEEVDMDVVDSARKNRCDSDPEDWLA